MTDSPSVAALSYIGAQVFGHSHGRWFTNVPKATAKLQTKHFAQLPPQHFLLLLQSAVKSNQTQLVEVSPEDIKEFQAMTAKEGNLEIALSKYKDS